MTKGLRKRGPEFPTEDPEAGSANGAGTALNWYSWWKKITMYHTRFEQGRTIKFSGHLVLRSCGNGNINL